MNPNFLQFATNEKPLMQLPAIGEAKNKNAEKKQIVQGMSAEEIADIISDHLIEIVKKQFQATKEALEREKQHTVQ